ncbi:subunit B of translation initiation factor 3 [Chloropicon primus]|uniref:Eukaryotic translation initiation factor 3 subunit B n=1 Tax=Chloropicon primus TaxID=1764295 RepID=A0A5B8MSK0_9CHLO|nr:subunit B of translation initiation factor 3 [Chloropicon primus]UPR02842.1 subunit B of translation initiation factor 3 [Chloropicon primus]|eukprot:QDZ23629.1 subunit B of translation initiation factor 3 [Chloropicon primus]
MEDVRTGWPWDGFTIDEVQLPDENDDYGVPSEDEEEFNVEELQRDTGFSCVVVVDNLPVVGMEKYEKLLNVLKKIFGQIGEVHEDGLYMPVDESTKKTKGFAFIEFATPDQAKIARQQADGYKLDKNHTFKTNLLKEVEDLSSTTESYKEPELKDFVRKDNLYEYMLDPRGRDQFAVRYQDMTEIHWNDPKTGTSEQVYSRSFWTESYVQWSPCGTMLATVHRQGAQVWGGEEFSRIQRFGHSKVQLIDFSPCEKYLVSYSSQESPNPREAPMAVFNVSDLKSGQTLRSFQGKLDDFMVSGGENRPQGGEGALQWPLFKWCQGNDDKYFARLARNKSGKTMISIYETPDMNLLDKKSLQMENIVDFHWSPKEALMCVYQGEANSGNQPARVSLVRIPSREEVKSKNLFSVKDVTVHWHPDGSYLALQVARFTKTKKSSYNGFEFFRVKERNIPMEVLELQNKQEKIVSFAWEPKGHRFAVVHGDGARPDVSFYTMKDSKQIKHLGTLHGRPVTSLHWSPQGKFLIIAGLKGLNGQLEFFNVNDMDTMAINEHFMCTNVDWDPTGRYVATSVTSVHQMENGYIVWSFLGQQLYKVNRDRFFQFLWRPRQKVELGEEKEAELMKNLKKFSKKFEEEDESLKSRADKEKIAEREKMESDWKEFLDKKRKAFAAIEAEHRRLLGLSGYVEADQQYEIEEVEVEEVLSVKQEKIH